MKSKRIAELDIVRAITIFFVVFGHALCYLKQAPFTLELIYSFHMPVLFTLSGFVAEMGWMKRSGGDAARCRIHDGGDGNEVRAASRPRVYVFRKIGRSAKRLLLPYVLCGALIAPLATAVVTGAWGTSFQESWGNYFLSNHGLWYLPACFILVCSHVASGALAAKRAWWIRVCVGLVLALPMFLLYRFTHCDFLRSALSYWLSFYVGVVLAHWPQVVTKPRVSVGCGLFIVWLVLAFLFAERPHSLVSNVIKPFSGIAAFFPLVFIANKLKGVRGLAGVGESALAIYCTEAIAGAWFFRILAPSSAAWAAFWSLIFVLAVHGASSWIVRRAG